MLVRHGKVVAEGWSSSYDGAAPHMLFSLSKSFTSTAVGLAIADGKLHMVDAVSVLPRRGPAQPAPTCKAMRIRNLLRVDRPSGRAARDSPSALDRAFLEVPVPQRAGIAFRLQQRRDLHALGDRQK